MSNSNQRFALYVPTKEDKRAAFTRIYDFGARVGVLSRETAMIYVDEDRYNQYPYIVFDLNGKTAYVYSRAGIAGLRPSLCNSINQLIARAAKPSL